MHANERQATSVNEKNEQCVGVQTLQLTDEDIVTAPKRGRLVQRLVSAGEYESTKIETRHGLVLINTANGRRVVLPPALWPIVFKESHDSAGGDAGDRVEYVTRYAVAVTVKQHTAKNVAEFLLNHVVLKFGPFASCPMRVVEPVGYDNYLVEREDVTSEPERHIARVSYLVSYHYPVASLQRAAADIEIQLNYENAVGRRADGATPAVTAPAAAAPVQTAVAASGKKRRERAMAISKHTECVTFNAPLCYAGVCKTPQFVNPTIDVFVKRMPATNSDSNTATNVWLLQVEASRISLFTQLDGTANIYTMDHRGVGRSTLLDCVAAQATTSGSPNGRDIDPSEVPACAHELANTYGDLVAFTVTSAANDLVTFMSKYTSDANTIVYGTSYGTVLVERVIHLNPQRVVGYVLDGIATTSGAPIDKTEYVSTWDTDFGEVGDQFLELCSEDTSCNSRFKKPNTLPKTLSGLLAHFDKNPNSTCAAIISKSMPLGDVAPSVTLRITLGTLLMDAEQRKTIPPVVYRLNRCDERDVEVLTHFVSLFRTAVSAKG
ncbi:Serine protease family S33 [Phytophthora cinnamomi]|uniref:Serine protease family S33 n=1 Tax=Phytophthora cinnamomi TaxID=4785 RepID=UPI0035595555|nr:Serine protease family S33 [Phytophthora cinnamomi]